MIHRQIRPIIAGQPLNTGVERPPAALRLLRAIIRATPRAYQGKYGAELLADYECLLADSRNQPRVRRVHTCVLLILDALGGCAAAHAQSAPTTLRFLGRALRQDPLASAGLVLLLPHLGVILSLAAFMVAGRWDGLGLLDGYPFRANRALDLALLGGFLISTAAAVRVPVRLQSIHVCHIMALGLTALCGTALIF